MKQLYKFSLKYNSTFRSDSAEESLSANSCPCLAIPCFYNDDEDEDDDAGAISTITSSVNTDSEHCSQMEAHFILQCLHICFDFALLKIFARLF